MAALTSSDWSVTDLGNGWRKYSSSSAFDSTAGTTITSPELPQDVKDHVGGGGAVSVGIQIGAGTIGNVTVVVNQDDDSTMTSPYTHQLTGTGAASTNYLFNYSHAEGGEPMPYLNIKGSRASGTATNTLAYDLIFKKAAISGDNLTIAGIGADPS